LPISIAARKVERDNSDPIEIIDDFGIVWSSPLLILQNTWSNNTINAIEDITV
jgi:hypothetical protein